MRRVNHVWANLSTAQHHRLRVWGFAALLAIIGWIAGAAAGQAIGKEHVVDSTLVAINPHLEDPDEDQRLGALGRTRDDAVLLGEVADSEEFHQRLATASGVEATTFQVNGTAVRRTRVITVRVSSLHDATSAQVAAHIPAVLDEFLVEHEGTIFNDTSVQFLHAQPVAVRNAGAGINWGAAGFMLGMLAGLTLVAVRTRPPKETP